MEKQYLAKYNKVWKHIKSGKILTDKLTLNKSEKLTDYKQIQKPKEPSKVTDSAARNKNKENSNKGGSVE